MVHKPVERSPDQAQPSENDVQTDQDRNDRVEHLKAGRPHNDQPGHDRDRRQHVGQQVLAVRFEDDRIVPPADAHQCHADREIESRGGQCERHADAEFRQRRWMKEPIDCDPAGANAGNHDEHALQPRREEFDLLVPVGVRGIHRPVRVAQREIGGDGGEQVDARLESIG